MREKGGDHSLVVGDLDGAEGVALLAEAGGDRAGQRRAEEQRGRGRGGRRRAGHAREAAQGHRHLGLGQLLRGAWRARRLVE